MPLIPTQPLLRVKNYLTEARGPAKLEWWQRRWMQCDKPLGAAWLELPHDSSLRPKDEDANWRKTWGDWVLLLHEGLSKSYVYYVSTSDYNTCRRTVLPVEMGLFAMRIGPDPVCITVVNVAGKGQSVGFGNFNHEDYNRLIRSETGLKTLAQGRDLPITFI